MGQTEITSLCVSVRVCVCEWVYMCKYIYVYMWRAHTNNGPFIKISMYAGLWGALSVSKVTLAFFSFLLVNGV